MSYDAAWANHYHHNRSYSVDTDDFIRHLKSKCYDRYDGGGTSGTETMGINFDSLRNLSKFERQLYVIDFMEKNEVRGANPFRSSSHQLRRLI